MLLTSLAFLIGPYSGPIWGAASAIITIVINSILNNRKQKADEQDHDRTQDRSDFETIRDTLYQELERLKEKQLETDITLSSSQEENRKCEQRYFELAIQHKELLRYCASIYKELKDLKVKVSQVENEQTRSIGNSKEPTD